MRRWSGVSFFVGLALLCGALIEFHRWPTLQVRTHYGDFDELEGLESERLETALGSPPLSLNEFVDRALSALLAFAALGVASVFAGRRGWGATLVTGSTVSGLALLALIAFDVRAFDRGIGCTPAPNPLNSPELLAFASRFALGIATLVALAWIKAARAAGAQLGRVVLAAGTSLAMVFVAFVFDRLAFPSWDLTLDSPIPALWPVWIVVALASFGVWFALRRDLYVSHAVSVLVFTAGLGALIPAVALEHDLRVEVHQVYSYPSRDELIPITHCEDPALAVVVIVTRDGAFVSGRDLSHHQSELSRAVGEAIEEIGAEYAEVHAVDEEQVSPAFTDRRFTLIPQADAPYENIVATVRGLQSVGVSRLQFVSATRRPEVLWTKAAPHRHQCAVFFELASDGVPMSNFASWPELVAAIDASATPLKLAAR